MAMLMKLFATSIVANNFFGRSSNLEIISIGFEFSSEAISMSDCVKENNATSAPETKAEQNNNTNNNTTPKIIDVSIASKFIIRLKGSGSKYYYFY